MNINAIFERTLEAGLLVGSVPEIPGAHTQGETIEEVRANLTEVIELMQSEGTSPHLKLATHMKSTSVWSLNIDGVYRPDPQSALGLD